jgi:hypothetical protein
LAAFPRAAHIVVLWAKWSGSGKTDDKRCRARWSSHSSAAIVAVEATRGAQEACRWGSYRTGAAGDDMLLLLLLLLGG